MAVYAVPCKLIIVPGASNSGFDQLPAFGDGFDHTVNYPHLPTLPSSPFSYPSLIDPLDDPSFSLFTSSTNHHSGFSESPSPSLAPSGQTAVYDKPVMQHGLAIGDGSGDQIGDQGRWNEAEQLKAQIMEMTKNLLGTEHPSISSPLTTESLTTDISAKAVTNRIIDYHDSTDPSCLDPSVVSTSRYTFEADERNGSIRPWTLM